MGWADCGTDSKGRRIGYGVGAHCDERGCRVRINRGLGFACGGMHGHNTLPASDFEACEGYFCSEHLRDVSLPGTGGGGARVCSLCAQQLADLRRENFHDLLEILTGLAQPSGLEAILQAGGRLDRLDEEQEQAACAEAIVTLEGVSGRIKQLVYKFLETWDLFDGLTPDPLLMSKRGLEMAQAAALWRQPAAISPNSQELR